MVGIFYVKIGMGVFRCFELTQTHVLGQCLMGRSKKLKLIRIPHHLLVTRLLADDPDWDLSLGEARWCKDALVTYEAESILEELDGYLKGVG